MGARKISRAVSHFTKWGSLIVDQPPSLLGLEETLLGGQSFSWTATTGSSWIGVIGKSVVELRFNKEKLEWRTARKTPFTEKELRAYLWLDPSYDDAIESLPWRSDPVLARCMKALPGLRILRQPMDEILFVFLLSSVKSIPQIKEMKELVAKKYGDELDSNLSSFPGWQRLAEVSEEDLRSLKLGYRAKYVRAVAAFLAERSSWLDQVISQTYEDAKESLLTLPGVGPKVADCCLLFGAAKTQAFPVDTWISKAMEIRYGLGGWTMAQQAHFAFKHYGKHAGLAQQFLFSGERLGLHEKA